MNHYIVTEKAILREGTVLSYKGKMSVEVINGLLSRIEKEFGNTDLKVRKRVFTIATESLQNSYHHASTKNCGGALNYMLDLNFTFEIKFMHDYYLIEIGNFVCNKTKDDIIDRIQSVNNASLSELRQMYINQLIKRRSLNRNTAGLGFIEMAKRSKNRLDYQFIPHDEFSSFLQLKIKVN